MIAKVIILPLFTILVFYWQNPVFAQSKIFLIQADLQRYGINNYENINPNLIIYPFKRYWENLIFLLTVNPDDKQKYTWQLYKKRFKELVYVINFNKTGFLLETVDRYNTFTGTIKAQNADFQQPEKEQIKNNLKLLEKLRDRYHSGSAYWSKIQQAVDTTRSLI